MAEATSGQVSGLRGQAQCAYATSVAVHGNGFIAAFTVGLAFAAAGGESARLAPFMEETGSLLSLLVWLMSGVIAVAPALPHTPHGSAAKLVVTWSF
ncbi:MAG TPA: hypothetical protein VKV33_02765 [Streptosporangiaceae bacterium]|nr:hypothetical protein [Streptosporangiaceae bacterium]